MANFPELLYVNSKITKPSELSPELFTSWYNDVHIPDIFVTSGIKEAYRYRTTAADATTIERPYLALYPTKFAGFLHSPEFYSIPVVSDVLPGPNHEIFDFVDFDTRYYKVTSSVNAFDGQYLLTVQYDGDAESSIADSVSHATFTCFFARQNREAPEDNEIGVPPSHLALVWYQSEKELETGAETASRTGKVAKFNLLKGFQGAS